MEATITPEKELENPYIEIWDNSYRARNLKIIFWILIGLTAIGLLTGYSELQLLKSIQAGYYIDENDAAMNDLM